MSSYHLAGITADALCLGSHWIYNQGKIARLFPDGITAYTDPQSDYHPNRKAGQLTHYGDQAGILAQSLEKRGGFDLTTWREDWLSAIAEYDGYFDGATKETFANKGLNPSSSNDLAGASRMGAILDLDISWNKKAEAAKQQAMLTHGDPGVGEAAEFLVRWIQGVSTGQSLREGYDYALFMGKSFPQLDPEKALEDAFAGPVTETALEAGARLGLTCHLPEAFPLLVNLALREDASFAELMSTNALVGGDNSARGMLLALLLHAQGKFDPTAYPMPQASSDPLVYHPGTHSFNIPSPQGQLAGVLEMPKEEVTGYALFAHCFTCGKDFLPESRITKNLAANGIATVRIDFSGLGKSGGSFEESSFVTNLSDLEAAADWMEENLAAPQILVGHSLGGAAVLAVAGKIHSVKAVATIAAPADPVHILHLIGDKVEEIEKHGRAEVTLAGRPFQIGQKFLDDLKTFDAKRALATLRGIDILLMHSPSDQTVGIENAKQLYELLSHPKSFLSLAEADHLLTKKEDAEYVASLIATWAKRSLTLEG